jgi:hypothetical protein
MSVWTNTMVDARLLGVTIGRIGPHRVPQSMHVVPLR